MHVLIETHGALRDVWQIAALPGVESIDFGLMDFVSGHHGAIPASAMRSPGQFEHRLIARAKAEVVAAALADNRPAIVSEDQRALTLQLLADGSPCEVLTPGGNWSSYPPHKHDTNDPPDESQLEELYLYRFDRPSGFALQRVYTEDRSLDEAVVAHDLDLVLVPRGYHVVGAAAGYDCWYLNVMAGPERVWRFTVDPAHRWLMDWDPTRPQAAR